MSIEKEYAAVERRIRNSDTYRQNRKLGLQQWSIIVGWLLTMATMVWVASGKTAITNEKISAVGGRIENLELRYIPIIEQHSSDIAVIKSMLVDIKQTVHETNDRLERQWRNHS